ncbi:hypothetical protein EV363DRAFT_1396372 [Boletus edulis]|nr:hypothetical protein EV363DRAFT_1396372 [Boletus edulis]
MRKGQCQGILSIPARTFSGDRERNQDTFGFGRRVCVGRYVAEASLWAAIVNMLTLFRFEPSPGCDLGRKVNT